MKTVDVNKAIKDKSFLHAYLNELTFETKGNNLKVLSSGNFGKVYFAKTIDGHSVIVKVYEETIDSVESVYNKLSPYLANNPNPYFLDAVYYPNSLAVYSNGNVAHHPVLIMQRAEGLELNYHIEDLLKAQDKDGLVAVRNQLIVMAESLYKQGISHRDIHPSNIFVKPNGEVILIDYDDIWIKDHVEVDSTVKGNREYQHPLRLHENHLSGGYLDNFGFGIIYIQLQLFLETLSHHKSIEIDQNFIFSSSDFNNLENSRQVVFYANSDKTCNWMAVLINELLYCKDLANIPPLTRKNYNRLYNKYADRKWQRTDEFYCPKTKVFF